MNDQKPTDDEIVAWADSFIREKAFNRPVAIQIAVEAAKWVRAKLAPRAADIRLSSDDRLPRMLPERVGVEGTGPHGQDRAAESEPTDEPVCWALLGKDGHVFSTDKHQSGVPTAAEADEQFPDDAPHRVVALVAKLSQESRAGSAESELRAALADAERLIRLRGNVGNPAYEEQCKAFLGRATLEASKGSEQA